MHIAVVVQGSEPHPRRLSRQLCYPLLSRVHEIGTRCFRHVSLQRVHNLTPRFPPPGPRGSRSPTSSVLSGRCDASPSFPLRFVAFARRYRADVCLFAPTGDKRRTPVDRGDCVAVHPSSPLPDAETTGPPTFLGNPRCLCPALRPRRDRSPQAFTTRRHGPRLHHHEGSRVDGFRGSITRPGHSRSTLRRTGCPVATPDSLSATGQVLPDGLSPAGFHRKVSATSSHPPFPSFVAQGASH